MMGIVASASMAAHLTRQESEDNEELHCPGPLLWASPSHFSRKGTVWVWTGKEGFAGADFEAGCQRCQW